MSGPMPAAISVAMVSRAEAFGVTSSTSLILSWEALKSATTAFSMATWLAASPVPIPTAQRITTLPSARPTGAAVAGAAVAGAAVVAGAPQAAKIMLAAAKRATKANSCFFIIFLLLKYMNFG